MSEKIKQLKRKLDEKRKAVTRALEQQDAALNKLVEELNKQHPHFLEEYEDIDDTQFIADTEDPEDPTWNILLLAIVPKRKRGGFDTFDGWYTYQKNIIEDCREKLEQIEEELEGMIYTRIYGEE